LPTRDGWWNWEDFVEIAEVDGAIWSKNQYSGSELFKIGTGTRVSSSSRF
jgi:hypothetical protein